MNRPREAMLAALASDLHAPALKLREMGWPAELIAFADDDGYGVRLEIRLKDQPIPVGSGSSADECGDHHYLTRGGYWATCKKPRDHHPGEPHRDERDNEW